MVSRPCPRPDAPLRWRALGSLALVLLLTSVAYTQFLQTGFGATDSLPLVASSRMRSVADALQQFRQPVMAGTRFVQGEVVYRPLPSVSLGVDELIWGLNAFGFHLTNVVLHVVLVGGVWTLLVTLGLRPLSASVGAAVFGLHPLVVATVPVIARRDSILPVLTTVAAAVFLVAADRVSGRARSLGLLAVSVVCATAALLSKESAFVGLVLMCGLWAGARLARGATLRQVIVGSVRLIPFALALAMVFVVRWSVVRGLGGGQESSNLFPPDFEKYSQTIGAFTRDLAWVVAFLASSTREVWPRLAAAVLVSVLACSLALEKRHGVLVAMGTLWVVGFVLFAAVLKINTIAWLAYFSLVGMALVFAAGLDGAFTRLRSGRSTGSGVARLASAGLALGLIVYGLGLLSGSPLVRRYDQWATAGAVTDGLWTALSACVTEHPQATRVVVHDVPSTLDDGRAETNMLGVTLIEQYTVDAMLDLRQPERAIDTGIDGFETLHAGAETLGYTCVAPAPDTVRLNTTY